MTRRLTFSASGRTVYFGLVPETNADGSRNSSMHHPLLVVNPDLLNPEDTAEQIAALFNEHWEE